MVTIPAGAAVEKCAFSYCEAVEKVCIEPGALLKARAFGYCDDIIQVICAEGSRLEENAFEYCRGMKKAYLCGEVQTEKEAFYSCAQAEVTETGEGEYDVLKQSVLDGSSDDSESSFPEEEKSLEIIHSPASLDGVTVTLTKATAQRTNETGFTYTFEGTIENNSNCYGFWPKTYETA